MSDHTDDDKDVADLLDELRGAIESAGGLGDEERTHLADLVRRIEIEADEDEDDDPDILDHLEQSLSRFEAEHVGLVETINRIANALSAGGI